MKEKACLSVHEGMHVVCVCMHACEDACVCVCVCVCACVRACVRVCECVRARMCTHVYICGCMHLCFVPWQASGEQSHSDSVSVLLIP